MDPEQTFLRVHARLSGMLVQLLTPRIRMVLEHMSLVVSISLLGLLAVMHVNFVAQPGCANDLSGSDIVESQLVRIQITSGGLWSQKMTELSEIGARGPTHSLESFKFQELDGDGLTFLSAKFWLNWIGSGSRRIKATSKFLNSDEEILGSRPKGVTEGTIYSAVGKRTNVRVGPEVAQMEFLASGRDSFRAAIGQILNKWNRNSSAFFKRIKQFVLSGTQIWNIAGWQLFMDSPRVLRMLRWRRLDSLIVQWLEGRSKAFEPTYLYTVEKGYFMLPEGAKSRHNVQTVNISISAQNFCFGNRWQQLLINSFIGYDTILMNSLLNARGQGYLYNFQTKELYDLSYLQESFGAPLRFEDYLVSKCGVLIMSLFVFFTTTMSVSFTLRETQARMLKFTVQLQHHARHHLPTFQLIFVHVIESLVFVPIMIGILFFLFEFYDDQLLAFMVLTLVWLCELFTMISVRTPMSMQYFPRFFLLYFLAFHIYFFSYAYGFSYLAFAATAAFMQHLVLYFWNRFEVPALQRFLRQRPQLQPQPGVQITSSTILTSTFHFTRLNARNTNLVGELGGHQPRVNQPEESNVTDNSEIIHSSGASLGGIEMGTSLQRNFQDGDGIPDVHSVDGNQVRRAYTGSVVTTDHQSRQTATRGAQTDSIRINPNTMQNNELRENDASGVVIQQATAQDLQQTPQTAAPVTNPNPLTSVLLWILGGPSDGMVSFLPTFRDFRVHGIANTDSPEQENRQHVRNSWWRRSSGWEGLRQRNGHSPEE